MRVLMAFVRREMVTEPTRQLHGRVPEGGGLEDIVLEPMSDPDVVVLTDHPDGPMLERYTAAGEFAGDTWHETFEDAKHQAEFEYGSALTDWQEVPAHVHDANEYAIRAARRWLERGRLP